MARPKKNVKPPSIASGAMPIPRLAVLLHEAAARCGGYSNLADRMPSRVKPYPVIDRRTLSSIFRGKDVSLKLSQLVVLDELLTELGVGRLLEGPKLLEALAECGHVAFLLGTYPRKEKRSDISFWDVQSVNKLMGGISHARSGVQFDIDGVPPVTQTTNRREEVALLKSILAPDGPSVIALGSPKACLATEVMLARFFGVAPFQPPTIELPFCFYWPANDLIPSAFARSFDDPSVSRLTLEPTTPSAHKVDEHWGLRVADRLYRENRGRKVGGVMVPITERRKSYGFVAAQRQPNGQVHACLAGLTGPASLGLSEAMITELAIRPIPSATHAHEPAPVWWVALEVDIQTDDAIKLGDNRTMGSRRIIGTSHPLRSPE